MDAYFIIAMKKRNFIAIIKIPFFTLKTTIRASVQGFKEIKEYKNGNEIPLNVKIKSILKTFIPFYIKITKRRLLEDKILRETFWIMYKEDLHIADNNEFAEFVVDNAKRKIENDGQISDTYIRMVVSEAVVKFAEERG
jgi:hypothetical protein